MKREHPSPTHQKILSAVAACAKPEGLRSSEIETASGMTAGEVRMATKWLSANGYVKSSTRSVRFNFGHQGFARKSILFWTLTDKGRTHLNSPLAPDQSPHAL